MAKILSIDDMLEAASECNLPSYGQHVANIEKVATRLAISLAKHLDIKTNGATWEGKEFAGTCASFYPKSEDQQCPEVIDTRDTGGDWEYEGTPASGTAKTYEKK